LAARAPEKALRPVADAALNNNLAGRQSPRPEMTRI
jgi:hypothetical protein